MIIWDEIKYGEEIYNNGVVKTKKWQYKELKCLIKYMLSQDLKPKDIRESLNSCCQDDIKYLTDKQKKNIFNKLIQQCKADEVTHNKTVTIYKDELEHIHEINNIQLESLMFVLLVYKKWLGNLEWFAIAKSDLFKTAKLNNVNSTKQQELLCKLFELGLIKSDVIKLSRKQRRREKDLKKQMWSLNLKRASDEVAFEFSNFTNIIFRYLNYLNGEYFECKKCHGMFKQNKKCNLVTCAQCSEYQPIGTKTIICCDCKKEVVVDGIVKNKIRCDECQKKYIREIKTQKQREYRNKL